MEKFTYWHGSDADFETFSDEFLVRKGSGPNSALGIWLGDLWVASAFGRYTYEVECSLNKILYMELRAMVDHHNESCGEREYFDDLRSKLIEQGYDAIFVRERDGKCPSIVVLDTSALRIVARREK